MPLKTCLWFCHSESLNAKLAVWLRSACQVYHLLKALSSSALRLSGSLLFTLFLGCLEKISLLFLIKMPADWIVWKASGGIRAICSRYCQRQSMSSDSYVILYLIAWNTSLFPCFLGFSLGLKHIQPNVFKSFFQETISHQYDVLQLRACMKLHQCYDCYCIFIYLRKVTMNLNLWVFLSVVQKLV